MKLEAVFNDHVWCVLFRVIGIYHRIAAFTLHRLLKIHAFVSLEKVR
jgi:hypothetical protein